MANDIVQPEDVSKDMLLSLFRAAYMDVSLDSDGDIMLKDVYRSWVFPSNDGRLIRLMSQFNVNPKASHADKLAYVNKVNDEIVLIRACVTANGSIRYDYHISVQGGTTRQGIVMAVKRFYSTLNTALEQDDRHVLG